MAVQSNFVTIAALLRDKLIPCEAVLCLIGNYYGFEPIHFLSGDME